MSKTIKNSSIVLEKYPANKVRQLAKKIEASKATVHHIKQDESDPQAAQINHIRHQCTDLLPSKNKKKQSFKSRPPSHNWYTSEQQVPPYKRKFDCKQAQTSKERCSKCGDSRHVEGFKCSVKKYQSMSCHKYGHFTSLCFKKQASFKPKVPKAHHLQAKEVCMQDDFICSQSEDFTSSDDSFCLQVRIQCVQADSKFHNISSHNQHGIQDQTTSEEKSVSESKTGYLGRCKHHASQCLQVSVL